MDADLAETVPAGGDTIAVNKKFNALKPAGLYSLISANKHRLLLTVGTLALLVANVIWLWLHRHGGAMNIDEAGYLRMSIDDYNSLHHGGLGRLIATVKGQTQAPLVPMLASFAYLVVGRPTIMSAYFVQLFAYLIIIITVYSIGTLMANRWAGLTAALTVASVPIMIDYIHDYSFAVPAAAATTVAIWAALRSDRMQRLHFAILWGIALGTMSITRTMTIAYIPSLLLLAILHVIVSPQRKRSLMDVSCGLAAAGVVAGPWYWVQGYNVWRYLTSFGYGAQSVEYGSARSLLSPSSWLAFAQGTINQYIWLPLAAVLFAGAAVLVARLVATLAGSRRISAQNVVSSPRFYLAVVTIEGLLALQSSRNVGSAFPTPIVPAMLILAVTALAGITVRRRSYGYVAIGAVAVLSLPSCVSKTAFNVAAGQPVVMTLPVLGSLTVVDARSPFVAYVSKEGELDPRDLSGIKWKFVNNRLVSALDSLAPASNTLPVVFAFNHSLVNVNTLGLDELRLHGVSPSIALMNPTSPEDSAIYSAQFHAMLGPGHGVILLSSDSRGMFPPLLDQNKVRLAALELGFELNRSLPLPDGADIEIWVR
jgi:hypothetical protein